MGKIKKIAVPNFGTNDVVDAGAVRFDEAQSLTTNQKIQARNNIGAMPADGLSTTTNLIKGNGSGGITAATPGTDYITPAQYNPTTADTSTMTQAVGKDSNGLLWTAPSGGGSGGTTNFNLLQNRPSYNGSLMTGSTAIPEVKTATWDAKYLKPSNGIPATDMETSVQTNLGLASTAIQPADYSPMEKTDAMSQDVGVDKNTGKLYTLPGGNFEALSNRPSYNQTEMDGDTDIPLVKTADWDAKYLKPSGGIPASDLANGVIPDISGKADKVSGATNNNFAALDANGNLKDSGKNANSFSKVSANASGSSTNTVKYLTVDSTEYKLPEGVSSFNELNGRPAYAGSTMTGSTAIPEVKTATWDAKYTKPTLGIPFDDLYLTVQNSLLQADGSVQKPSLDVASGCVPTCNGDGGYSWRAQTGGGGDFNQLSNRPKYAGSTMTSSTDIPNVATKIDKPTVGTYAGAMPYCNGNADVYWGSPIVRHTVADNLYDDDLFYKYAPDVATTDKNYSIKWSTIKAKLKTYFNSYYGTYSKPSGGIPAEDLASSVQQKLTLANSALQPSALNAYRTSVAQDTIDATKLSDAPNDNKTYGRRNGAWAEVTGGGSEPAAYLKSASVSGNTLTLTNKDDTTTSFTPSEVYSFEVSVNFSTGIVTLLNGVTPTQIMEQIEAGKEVLCYRPYSGSDKDRYDLQWYDGGEMCFGSAQLIDNEYYAFTTVVINTFDDPHTYKSVSFNSPDGNTNLVKADGQGGYTPATPGTDYVAPSALTTYDMVIAINGNPDDWTNWSGEIISGSVSAITTAIASNPTYVPRVLLKCSFYYGADLMKANAVVSGPTIWYRSNDTYVEIYSHFLFGNRCFFVEVSHNNSASTDAIEVIEFVNYATE